MQRSSVWIASHLAPGSGRLNAKTFTPLPIPKCVRILPSLHVPSSCAEQLCRSAAAIWGFERARFWRWFENLVFRVTLNGSACYLRASPVDRRSLSQVASELDLQVLILDQGRLDSAVQQNPFPEAVSDPKSLHFYFLASLALSADADVLQEATASGERYHLANDVFYLHAPQGVARSKLAANAEKYLGVTATARNLRTVQKVLAMAMEG